MSPVTASSQVFDAIQKAKTGASAFCTNFFPVQSKLDAWIKHAELFEETREGAAFFFRKDQDFWHWYFCAADTGVLKREAQSSSVLRSEPTVVDLVGRNGTMAELLGAVQSGGFKDYSRLVRLARTAKAEPAVSEGPNPVIWAEKRDVPAVLGLIETAFDRFADQLPTAYELEAAIDAKQILLIRQEGEVAALLFFETQGVTSTVRYWVVAEKYRANHYGSALIRHYFGSQTAVRRFVLWVTANNENAVEKYHHYGYSADGLVDHVLINDMIRA